MVMKLERILVTDRCVCQCFFLDKKVHHGKVRVKLSKT